MNMLVFSVAITILVEIICATKSALIQFPQCSTLEEFINQWPAIKWMNEQRPSVPINDFRSLSNVQNGYTALSQLGELLDFLGEEAFRERFAGRTLEGCIMEARLEFRRLYATRPQEPERKRRKIKREPQSSPVFESIKMESPLIQSEFESSVMQMPACYVTGKSQGVEAVGSLARKCSSNQHACAPTSKIKEEPGVAGAMSNEFPPNFDELFTNNFLNLDENEDLESDEGDGFYTASPGSYDSQPPTDPRASQPCLEQPFELKLSQDQTVKIEPAQSKPKPIRRQTKSCLKAFYEIPGIGAFPPILTGKDVIKHWQEYKRLKKIISSPVREEHQLVVKRAYYPARMAARLLYELGEKEFRKRFGKKSLGDCVNYVKNSRRQKMDSKLKSASATHTTVRVDESEQIIRFPQFTTVEEFVKLWPESKRMRGSLPKRIEPGSRQKEESNNWYYRFRPLGKLLKKLGPEAFLKRFTGKSLTECIEKVPKKKVKQPKAKKLNPDHGTSIDAAPRPIDSLEGPEPEDFKGDTCELSQEAADNFSLGDMVDEMFSADIIERIGFVQD